MSAQAIDELTARIEYWLERAALYGFVDLPLRRGPRAFAVTTVGELSSGGPRLAGQAAQTVVEWLGTPDDPIPDGFWPTELGRLVARATWQETASGDHYVSVEEAAAMLRVSRATVSRMIADGRVEVGPGHARGHGQVSRRSIGRALYRDDIDRLERGDYTVDLEQVDDGWWQAQLREAPGVITAQPTREEAESAIQDAVGEYITALRAWDSDFGGSPDLPPGDGDGVPRRLPRDAGIDLDTLGRS